ncbi:MAG: glycosyl hydrolase family 28-related protein, partial [bacterium]
MSPSTHLFLVLGLLLLPVLAVAGIGKSVYTQRVEDSRAVYLVAKGDGVSDDTEAIQAAIDKVQATTHQGIVLVPEGRYRISKTILVWPGIRLIGYGVNRPTFVLGKQTAGFQEGEGKYMFWFTGGKGRDNEVRDANPGTFYSAFSNCDIEIEPGNPAAVGVRSHWAQ